MYDILIRNARLSDDRPLEDIAINGKTIEKIGESIPGEAGRIIDAKGHVVIPGLIESHLHLDKALIADRKPNRSGTLAEAIQVTGELKPTFTSEDIEERATALLHMLAANGVTHVRTQSEFDPSGGFDGFKVIMGLKEKFKGIIDLQVVAFPQEGILKSQGTLEMMHEALQMGADVVGGIPYNDTDPIAHMDLVFDLAEQYNVPVDFHQDFKDDADGITIMQICEKTMARGFVGRVSVGHLTALAALPPEELAPIAKAMAEAQISVMSLPATDLHLGGRNDRYNVRRAITPVRSLRDAGVNVCISTNNVRNPFTPYGNGDTLLTVMLAVAGSHLGGADDLKTVLPMVTTNAAKALGLKDYGLKEGGAADLVLLSSTSVGEVVIDMPIRELVIKDGKITVETTHEVKRYY